MDEVGATLTSAEMNRTELLCRGYVYTPYFSSPAVRAGTPSGRPGKWVGLRAAKDADAHGSEAWDVMGNRRMMDG